MRERPVHHPLWILLALGFLAGLALDAAAYERPTTEPPTDADLVLIGGKSKTVVVRLLNLTPYTINQDLSGITAVGSLDKDRKIHKSFMFAPVGWPTGIPGLDGDWTQDPVSGWVFTPYDTNANPPKPYDTNKKTHPYSFVVAWDDQGGYVSNSSMGWTIKEVYSTGHGDKKDVPLRLWFTRVKPDNPLLSEVFELISNTIDEIVSIIGVATEPANPLAWLDAFAATKELTSAAFEAANSRETGGDKMYLAAYVVPDDPTCSGTNCTPAIITHSTSGESTDAVDVQWSTITGSYSANIVVTTHLLRGLKLKGYAFNGSVPIVGVVVWTPEEYTTAKTIAVAKAVAAAGQQTGPVLTMRATLGTPPDLSRVTQFELLYQSLNPSQQRTFHEALESLWSHYPLTQQQQVLLEKMAAAMEKGQTTIHPANR